MNDFEQDEELKGLWGDSLDSKLGKRTAKALNEMSEVTPPRGLKSNLKNLEDHSSFFGRYHFAPVFASVLVLFLVVFKFAAGTRPDAVSITGVEIDSAIEYSVFSDETDEDIFDDSLNNMEEIIWSA